MTSMVCVEKDKRESEEESERHRVSEKDRENERYRETEIERERVACGVRFKSKQDCCVSQSRRQRHCH